MCFAERGNILATFAHRDMQMTNFSLLEEQKASVCGHGENGLRLSSSLVQTTLMEGLFGQTLQQLDVIFAEMQLLAEKFHDAGLGEPRTWRWWRTRK